MLRRLYYVVEIITGVKSFTAQAPCREIIVDVFLNVSAKQENLNFRNMKNPSKTGLRHSA
jgi:hypothetical protein